MMKQFITTLLLLVQLSVYAQTENSATFSIEVDPAAYMLKGYSVSFKYGPKKMPRALFMASVYRSNFPDGMMKNVNKINGWKDMKIKTSYAVFAEFYSNEKRSGFFYGPTLFLYHKNVSYGEENKSTDFKTIYPGLRAGFSWYPIKKCNFYLSPWLSAGSEINLDNRNTINGNSFEPNRFNYIIAIHLGYQFSK
jgi:hypothetical protein